MPDKLQIPINKAKALWLTLGCLVFVTTSIWLWTIADKQTRRSPIMIKIVSVAGISFFGLGLIIGPKKLLDKKAGLIIDDQGIHDNASVGSGQFIPWENIEKFKVLTVNKTDTLLIYINNVEEAIRKESKWKQKIMRYCLKHYGTPISVGISTLKTDSNSLIDILSERHLSFKQSC